ncbi:hypothetical protein L7F22_065042 [Adiantum nelumboides]|nr:hypothetical protein [Adiantum nelumboides]
MASFLNGASIYRATNLRRMANLCFNTRHRNLRTCPSTSQGQQQKPPCLHIQPASHFAVLLQSLCKETSIVNGYIVHDLIVKSGFDQFTYLQNMLIQVYAHCGYMENACTCFFCIRNPDQYSWNFMIKFFAQQGNIDSTVQFYYQMQCVGILPDEFAFVSMLSVCSSAKDLSKGMHIHAIVVSRLNKLNIIVGTAIVTMYGKCGNLENAEKVFGNILEHDRVAWNAMLALYDQLGQSQNALTLLGKMLESHVSPDEYTFTSIVSACTDDISLAEGRELHDQIIRFGLESKGNLGNCLVNLYVKGGSLYDGQKIFDKYVTQSIVAWTTMIRGYLQYGFSTIAFFSLDEMLLEGVLPDQALLVSVFSSLAELQVGKTLHARIIGTEFESDAKVSYAVLSMYINSGSAEDASITFNRLSNRALVAWTTMMTGCAQEGQVNRALELLEQSRVEGVGQDKVMLLSIISACANALAYLDGKRIHACVRSCGSDSDVSVGNALVNMYKRCGLVEDTFTLFAKMDSWDIVTFISMLSACGDQAALQDGKLLHVCLMESGLDLDGPLRNALLTMYGRSGSLFDARAVFDKAHLQNLALRNAMIESYAQNGHGNDALEFFNQILQERMSPDAATFVSVLSACGHSGLVDEAYMYLVSMSYDYGMTVEVDHFNCMVDLLGRIGRLEEAELIILGMSCNVSNVSWLTLLSACREHMDVTRAERAAERAFAIDPKDAAPFIALSNVYFAVGRREDSAKLIESMRGISFGIGVNKSGK